jgi:ribose transport system permease protein
LKRGFRFWLSRNDTVFIAFSILLVTIIVGALLNPIMLKGSNIGNVMEQVTALGIVSIGQAIVILTGGIDLSVGATISLTVALLSVFMTGGHMPILLSLLIVIAVGALIGVVNGIGITRFKIPPFVMTLGTMSIVSGIALKVRPTPGGEIAMELSDFLDYRIGQIPVAVLFLVVLLTVFILLLKKTRYGRNIYAVGGSEQTAKLSGINVARMKLSVYVLSGVLASLAGIYVSARMGTGDASVGKYFALDAITVAVLGGINLFGGRGSLVGIIAAMLVLTLLNNILNLIGVDTFYQYILKGAILLIVVSFYAIRGNLKKSIST